LKERIGGERDHEDKVTLGIILLFCVSWYVAYMWYWLHLIS
jgi:hypothetical protein